MFPSSKHLNNLCKIFRKAVDSVQPEALLTKKRIEILKDGDGEIIKIDSYPFNLTDKKCHIVGFGKAVIGMAIQLERILGYRLKSGILSVPIGTCQIYENIISNSVLHVYEGAENNLPDNKSLATAVKIKSYVENLNKDDVLFVMISGGGSALLPIPTPPITLVEKLTVINELANKGANIKEINAVRTKISETKGGKLALAARKSYKIISLVLSDIIDDPTDLIASGPTVPHFNSQMDPKRVLEKYSMWDSIGPEIKKCILKDSDTGNLRNCSVQIIGSNRIAAECCLNESKMLGYIPTILSTRIEGNVIDVANTYIKFILNIKKLIKNEITESQFKLEFPFDEASIDEFFKSLKSAQETKKPLCLILGGEPTVRVKPGPGKGGRNQELALRISLSFYENELLKDVTFLSAGTDGIDGPTDAAGALGSHDVILEFLQSNTLDKAKLFLQNSDSFNFYRSIENGKYHIITGHTGTNVMDLHLFILPIM